MRNKGSPKQERASKNRKLRRFLSFRAPYWDSNKIESKVPATTIPNLVLIYRVHLTSCKVSQKEFFIANLSPKDKVFTEKQSEYAYNRFKHFSSI